MLSIIVRVPMCTVKCVLLACVIQLGDCHSLCKKEDKSITCTCKLP